MISNMQHQQFDSVVMDKILPSSQSVVVDKYVNNNNTNNMNKNIHIMTSADLITTVDQNPDVIIFDPSVDYVDNNSSSDTKETIVIAASQSLYENAPLIRAIPITTTTTNPNATAIIKTNSNQNVGSGTSGKSQSPGKTGLAAIKIKEELGEKDYPNHEYALISAKSDQQNELLVGQNQATSIKSCYNNQRGELPRSHYVRQESRTAALRCMDIHNYSKVNRFDDSTNSSSPEEDEDDDDEDDVDDDYDDVFGTTTATAKLSSSNPNTSIGRVTDKDCDSTANKSHQQRKQSQSNVNQNKHHIEIAVMDVTTSPTIKSSLKGGATASSSSPTSNINSPTGGTNCTDGPDDMENGENSGGMSGDKLAPDHHARRPMNAFLIFCKRHRAIVREKYKNLENRQITKILGEWWATLSNNEKACYTDLAKQYKDAFFKANPNFKWYKLPAPPLRTCSIRPGHQSPTSPLMGNSFYMNDNYNTSNLNGINDDENDRFNCDNGFVRKSSTSINNTSDNIYSDTLNNRNINNSNSGLLQPKNSAVGVFKLADEAQMGGLSSLMCSGSNSGGSSSSNSPNGNGSGTFESDKYNTSDNKYRGRIDPRHDALQNALSETSDFLSSTMPSCRNDMEPFQHMRNHAIHMESNQMLNGKRKASDSTIDWNAKKKLFVSTECMNEYEMGPQKASRSCKGKRYKELMISGQIISSGKKGNQKVRTPTSGGTFNGYYKTFENAAELGNHSPNISENLLSRTIKTEKFEYIIPDRLDNHCQYGAQAQPESPNSQKQFDASDFDLEEKIKALPAQCLESYLIRKRETKKKKKIGSKRRVLSSSSQAHKQSQMFERQLLQNNKHTNRPDQLQSPPKTIQEARERIQCGMVGSQKRKARKESITRRDVNTILSSVELLSPSTNSLFEAVGLVNKMTDDGSVEIKVECDVEPYHNEDENVGGMMPVDQKIRSELGPAAAASNTTIRTNGAPTSDLLILAEVATNHIAGEVNN